jgi:hypothetical protein
LFELYQHITSLTFDSRHKNTKNNSYKKLMNMTQLLRRQTSARCN